jgi:polyhydroxyalkanoate synthase
LSSPAEAVQGAQAAPQQAQRQGPRPLPLHLGWAATILLGSLGALPHWRSGSPQWNPAQWGAALQPALAALGESLAALQQREAPPRTAEAFAAAVDAEARRRLGAVLDGILAYRHSPYRRDLVTPPAIWAEGTTRLLDYRGAASRNSAPAVLVVPSLINRAYVLDLMADRSFMRFLAAAGIAPFLLDWDAPGPAEQRFALTDYIGRIERAVDLVAAETRGPPLLLGYCMGGTLTAAAAAKRPRAQRALIALAAPWDFHAGQQAQAGLVALVHAGAAPFIAALGQMPVDIIQSFFAALDPTLAIRKFARFATLPPQSEEARRFVALEDWLNDGVPLVAGAAQECLRSWYGANAPAAGAWRVGGTTIDPSSIAIPSLMLVPTHDRIVPPASAQALADRLPQVETWRPSLGHIGMMASAAAPQSLWQPLAEWVKSRG